MNDKEQRHIYEELQERFPGMEITRQILFPNVNLVQFKWKGDDYLIIYDKKRIILTKLLEMKEFE